MKYKYFGCLKESQINSLNENSKINLLKEKNLIILSSSKDNHGSIKRRLSKLLFQNNINLKINNYSYSKHVASDYLSFLINHYSRFIDGDVYQYNKEFDLKTYLLKKKKAKAFALEEFNKVFEMIVDVRFIALEKDVNGKLRVSNRFKLIDRERNYKYIDGLRHQKESVFQYLTGNLDFFDVTFFDNNGWLREIIDFEIGTRILKYLNDRFQFEIADNLNDNEKAKFIYKNFQGEFDSLEQLIFIENQIENQQNIDRAFVVALFYFFKKKANLKMPSAKLFTQIINGVFNLDIGLIKDPSSQSKAHLNRSEKLKNEWENFNSRI